MQTIQLPDLYSDGRHGVAKLWLAPGAARVGALYGSDIRYPAAAVCWDAVGRQALWDINLSDGDDEYADPVFDRDVTRVVYESPPNWAWNVPGDVRVRDLATGHEVTIGGPRCYHPTLAPDGRAVFAVAVVPGGANELRRWSLPAAFARERAELAPDRGWLIRQPNPRGDLRQLDVMLTALGVSPDGSRVAGGRYNGTLAVWNARNRKELMTAVATKQTRFLRYRAHQPTFAPSGSPLVALCERRKAGKIGFDVGVWEVATGEKLKGPKEKASVNGVAFSPDGATLLTAREDGTVGVWDVPSASSDGVAATWKLRREYAWKIGKLFSVAFAPDGLTCAAGGEKGRVVVWDVDV